MLLSLDDAGAAVRRPARVAHQVIPGATGAGRSLLDEEGTRISTASTDQAVGAADALQYELGTGTCLSESLKAAPASRVTVAPATGVLMSREHLAAEAAPSVLLEQARAQDCDALERDDLGKPVH
ncbi:hypothetical protein [Kocuria nitroreducens]|uniref:hypothetical protein n=1 Tax=Kocuria nitroreducens TaxID=3058914 RepID=UPI0036D87BA4